MHCPFCRSIDTRVLDSRVADDGSSIRRRRSCPACERRFTTVEQMQLSVIKRSGISEPFTREKAISGVRKACKGRPVSEDHLARLGQQVEDTLRGVGFAEVPANEIGLAILGPLRELDEVAYLRFASVYRAFESAEDFETEIAILRAERPQTLVEERAETSAVEQREATTAVEQREATTVVEQREATSVVEEREATTVVEERAQRASRNHQTPAEEKTPTPHPRHEPVTTGGLQPSG